MLVNNFYKCDLWINPLNIIQKSFVNYKVVYLMNDFQN